MAPSYRGLLAKLYEEFGGEIMGLAQSVSAAKITHSEAVDPLVDPDDHDNWTDSAAYYDGDRFEQDVVNSMAQKLALRRPEDVVKIVAVLIDTAAEVAKFEEAQKTVRAGILAERDVALARIEMQKAALLSYLDRSFDERKENFQKLFSVVDHALENDNIQELGLGLKGIIQLAESSPFKDLGSIEATTSALADPDHEWDF